MPWQPRAADGKTVLLKVVNPEDKPVEVQWTIKEFSIGEASMQLVAPDTLQARNTLESPDAIQPVSGPVERNGSTLHFRLPRWSAAVIEARRE